LKIPFIQKKPIPDHISGKKNVLQTIVVDVANSNASAIVEIDVIGNI
jgi:hypothetical protein